jgi:tRNA pseudouridine65 synthase
VNVGQILNCLLPADKSGFVFLRSNAAGEYQLFEHKELEAAGIAEYFHFELIDSCELLDSSIGGMRVKVTLGQIDIDFQPPDGILKISLNEAVNRIAEGVITDLLVVAALLKAERFRLVKTEADILYLDDYCVAVNKPSGLLVHRSHMAIDNDFLLQRVRNQLDKKVYPVHRLDRQTSGIVLFAFSSDYVAEFFKVFRERNAKKIYLAVVRGWTEDSGVIDYPLKTESGKEQDAVTEYETIGRTELPIPVGPYETARYSLVKIDLKTGRTHQIRRHFAHLRHPLVGDTNYGDGRHNRMFRSEFNSHRLLLAAVQLELVHPYTNNLISVKALLDKVFFSLLEKIKLISGESPNPPIVD